MTEKLEAHIARGKLLSRRKILTNGCWKYTGCKHTFGYGLLRFNGKLEGAHRISMAVFKPAEFNSRLQVNHKCGNPACFNPEHLYCGTQAQNVQDSVRDGTHVEARKTHCPSGHEYTESNTYITPSNGKRKCRICAEAYNKVSNALQSISRL